LEGTLSFCWSFFSREGLALAIGQDPVQTELVCISCDRQIWLFFINKN
jgi:hypothetical protein